MTKKEIALESDGDEMKLLDNSDIDRKEVEIIVGDIIILTDVPSNIYNAVINNLGTSTKIDGNELSCHIANFLVVFRILCHFFIIRPKGMTYDQTNLRYGSRPQSPA